MAKDSMIVKTSGAVTLRSLALAAGAAVSLLAAQSAMGVTEERFALRWGDWAALNILGAGVVVGSFDGAQPNVNHASFSGAHIVQIAYPLPSSVPNRLEFVTPHATAALGAMGARNPNIGTSPFGGIIGFAPATRMITANFAAGFDPATGAFDGQTNESIFFALMAMADQDFADAIAPHLGLPRYRVASVINSSFGNPNSSANRSGEGSMGQMFNVVSSMTNATIIGAAGNAGNNQAFEQINPSQGSMAAPASAHNVIAVGYTNTGLVGQQVLESSRGMQAISDWRVQGAGLLPTDADFPLESPPPTDPEIFGVRNGVDIVAPGVNLELPGNPLVSPLHNTASFQAWTGSSFSSSIVAGAVALLHNLHRNLYFADPENAGADEFDPDAVLSPLVTKAILLNSARKTGGWSNNAQPGEGGEASAALTTTPFDQRFGAGRLDMRRLLHQYIATPAFGGYRDIVPGGTPVLLGYRRNPSITDPNDFALANFQSYVLLDEGSPPRPLLIAGTSPNIAMIAPTPSAFIDPNSGIDAGGFRSTFGPTGESTRPAPYRHPPSSGPIEAIIEANNVDAMPMRIGLERPGGGDPPLGSPGGDGGLSGGAGPGSSGGNTTSDGGGGGGGGTDDPTGGGGTGTGFGEFFFSSGWDHGMIGKGFLDLPLGIVSTGSRVSVTLTWKRRMILDQRVIDAIAASVAPTNRSITESMMMDDPRVRHQLRHYIERTPEEGGDVDVPVYRRGVDGLLTEADLFGAEPTMMAGVTVTAPGGPVPITESDSPANRVDPNEPTSPFLGVAAMRLGSGANAIHFSGVIVGPRHILTAAHPFDPANIGELQRKDLFVFFNGVDGTDTVLRFDPIEVQTVTAAPGYAGIDTSPFTGQFIGFRNDVAVVTLRDTDRNGDPIDLVARGIPTYPIITALPVAPEVAVLAGYGESGTGDVGFTTPPTTSVKRVGFNEIADGQFFSRGGNPADLYEYDFDPPAPEFFGDLNTYGGLSLGNKLETLHAPGDSGGPLFRWFDANTDGVIQTSELRLFGINTYRRRGPAAQIGQFGTLGGGQIVGAYSSFINDVIDATDPPVDPTITPFIAVNNVTGILRDLVGFDHQKLNLELYRRNFDGSGFILAGRSSAEWELTQIIATASPDIITFGDYFIRILYAGTAWDFGGFKFAGVDSIPQTNIRGVPFTNFFDGDIEYALAWYVDLVRDPNVFPTRGASRSAEQWMGDMNHDAAICGKDLGVLLSLWGKTGEPGRTRGDLNGDGVVDSKDLAILLGNYTGPRVPYDG